MWPLLPAAVLLDVLRSRPQDGGIVPQQAETLVASLAEQGSDPAVVVIMIKVLRISFPTDGAPVALCRSELEDLGLRQLVLPVEVGLRIGHAVAGPAPGAEPRGGASVPDVVLVRDRLLAGRAPTEAIRYP
jgi:hypothetical protein